MTSEEFNNLPRNQQKVEIAKDVIAQIKAKKFIASNHLWANIHEIKVKNKDNMQELLVKNNPVCDVCADGALLLSAIRLGNDLIYSSRSKSMNNYRDLFVFDLGVSGLAKKRLLKYFTEEEFTLLEIAYEVGMGYKSPYSRDKEIEDARFKALEWGKRYNSNSKRLIALMKIIIKNNGEIVFDYIK